MGTYSAEWATKVYYAFVETCTRAQQIDACIIQTIKEFDREILTKDDIRVALIHSLRIKGGKTWNKYRKLVKSPGFDVKLLAEVSRAVENSHFEVDVEKKQRQFDFT